MSTSAKGFDPRFLAILEWQQCDQIWQNCAIWQNFKVCGSFLRVQLVFSKIMNLLWQTIFAFGEIFMVSNGQIFQKILQSGHTVWQP